MFKASIKLFNKHKGSISFHTSYDHLRMVKNEYLCKVMPKSQDRYNANFELIPDEDIVKYLSYYFVTRNGTNWLNDNNKNRIFDRLRLNDDLWTPQLFSNSIKVLQENYPDKISDFYHRIDNFLSNISENIKILDINSLTTIIKFVKKEKPEFHSVIFQAFTEKFCNEKDWNTYHFVELIDIYICLSDEGLVGPEKTIENFSGFLDRISYYTEHNFNDGLPLIEDFLSLSKLLPPDYLQKYHNLVLVKLYEDFNVGVNISLDQLLIYIKILNILIVPKEMKIFVTKKLMNYTIPKIIRFNNKEYNLSSLLELCSKLCSLLINLRLSYPEILFKLSIIYKLRYQNLQQESSIYILEALAFFNIEESLKLLKLDKLYKINEIINYMINEEYKVCKSLIEKNSGSTTDFEYILRFLWACSVFNSYSFINFKIFINYLNSSNHCIPLELYNINIQVRNWMKFILKIDQKLNIHELNQKFDSIIVEDPDLTFLKEFKAEASKSIVGEFVVDAEVEGMKVDFLNPEKKIAVFLESYENYTYLEDFKVTFGNKLISDRIFKELGYTVENLKPEDLIHKNKIN